jgi:protein phosphatase 2C family protein 2/3
MYMRAAEFRGPGIHHRYDDSPEDFDMDMMSSHDHRARSFGGLGGRIILLGDGTEIDPNGPDADMFDHEEEDGDLEHQVHRVVEVDSEDEKEAGGKRGEREGTPGPEAGKKTEIEESPSSVKTEGSEKATDTKPEEKKTEEKKKEEEVTKA